MIRWPYFESSPLRPLLEQLLSEERQRGGGPRGEPMPVNVYETDDGVVIDAAVPGAGPDDVDIQCAEGVLTIRARSQVPEREFMHQEIRPVEYLRQLALPADCRRAPHGRLQPPGAAGRAGPAGERPATGAPRKAGQAVPRGRPLRLQPSPASLRGARTRAGPSPWQAWPAGAAGRPGGRPPVGRADRLPGRAGRGL